MNMFSFSGGPSTFCSNQGLIPDDPEDAVFVTWDESEEPDFGQSPEPEMAPFDKELEDLYEHLLHFRDTKKKANNLLPPEIIAALGKFARRHKQVNRISSMNSIWGASLRLLNQDHTVLRRKNKTCALCGTHNAKKNEQNKAKLRPRSRAYCADCDVHLCTIPQKGYNDTSCWHHWHTASNIKPRTYFALENPEDTE